MKIIKMNRRSFLKRYLSSAGIVLAAPSIITSKLFGKEPPSDTITIGQIGCGRIARSHDMPLTMKNSTARIIACCDVDSKRANEGKQFIEPECPGDYAYPHGGEDRLHRLSCAVPFQVR